MWMSKDEIKSMYKHAKNKKHQIEILAELNACSKQDIIDIIENRQKREMPDIIKMLYETLDLTDAVIKELNGHKKLEQAYTNIVSIAESLSSLQKEGAKNVKKK